ncbi:MAG: F0F1 ATP synthase subunit A [Balneolaceae bacterium]
MASDSMASDLLVSDSMASDLVLQESDPPDTPGTGYSEVSDEAGSDSPIDVMGTVLDHDYLEIAGFYLYLPRIYYVAGRFYVYASTQQALDSGEFVMEQDGIVRADGTPVAINFSITSHLMFVWFGIILTFLITWGAARRYKSGVGSATEPRGILHNIFEVLYVFIRDDIAREYIPGEKYRKYVTYLFSIFMSITFMNLFGLLPWGASATADLTVTATLAGITFFITQFSGTRDYWQHIFMFPGVHPLVRLILTPVEIIGLFTKPLALAIRLFANMLSGKIMIICILGLIFIFTEKFGAAFGMGSGIIWVSLTVLLYALKTFIALLQAYIFTLLSAVFIGMAAEEHQHEETHDTSVVHSTDVNG